MLAVSTPKLEFLSLDLDCNLRTLYLTCMRSSEIDVLAKSTSEADREKCIRLLESYLQENSNDVKSWYDLACCFDFLGRETEAEPNYKKVFALGTDQLPLKDQMGLYVGYCSTLRKNKKFDESKKVLREGIAKFPDYVVLKVFLGFALYSNNEHQEANRVLLDMAAQLPTDVLDGYGRAVRWHSDNLDKLK